MGRRRGSQPLYYWLSKKEGKRVGWFFPSRKAANKWRQSRFYKYVDSPTLDLHLMNISKTSHVKETILWNRHKDGFEDLVLRMAYVYYEA